MTFPHTLRRSFAPLLALVVLALAAAPADASFFSPSSFWNAGVSGASIDIRSPVLVASLNAEIAKERASQIGPWINTTQYSTPLYKVSSTQPRVPVVVDQKSGPDLQRSLSGGVPIPDGALAAKGSDQHMTIYQASTDTLWDFWGARKPADGWHIRWGGVQQPVSQSPGYYTKTTFPGLQPWEGWYWGATAGGFPVIGGTVLVRELQAGVIPHALALALPDTCTKTFTWPAQRTDGTSKAVDCIPTGARFRLDPALDLSTLDLPPAARALAVAAQRYGIVVRDKTYWSTNFYAEDPAPSGTNPYPALFSQLSPTQLLANFPWSRLQLLPMTTCTSGPCPAPAETVTTAPTSSRVVRMVTSHPRNVAGARAPSAVARAAG